MSKCSFAISSARIAQGDTVMVIGCGAVGLPAVQGTRLAGAGQIIAVDLDDQKLALAERVGATLPVNARNEDPIALARARTGGRGADVVLEAAGSAVGFRTAAEAVRPGGEVIWLGKIDVESEIAFRWGSLMAEKRIRRPTSTTASPPSNPARRSAAS